MTIRTAGFYWARRKDDRSLTVLEFVTREHGRYFHMFGNSNILVETEAGEFFVVLDRIPEPSKAQDNWIDGEREATIAALRILCGDFGDNDWLDDLHLADVVEKHLSKHLHTRGVSDESGEKK